MIIKRYREGEVHYLGNQEPLEKKSAADGSKPQNDGSSS